MKPMQHLKLDEDESPWDSSEEDEKETKFQKTDPHKILTPPNFWSNGVFSVTFYLK